MRKLMRYATERMWLTRGDDRPVAGSIQLVSADCPVQRPHPVQMIDGGATAIVRPHFVTHERQRELERERRRTLVPAITGIDLQAVSA